MDYSNLINLYEDLIDIIQEMNTSIGGMVDALPVPVAGNPPYIKQDKGTQKNSDRRYKRRVKIRKATMK